MALAAVVGRGLCRRVRGTRGRDTLDVVATTTQLQDLVRNVGGARVSVEGILTPNVDPHEYEPRPSDAVALHRAKLIVESGVGLDAWMGKLIGEAGGDAPVVVASKGLRIRPGDAGEPDGDPHWWHDPVNFEQAAGTVAAALGQRRSRRPRRRSAATPGATSPVCGRWTPPTARTLRAVPGRAADARHEPRRVRLLRRALRHHGSSDRCSTRSRPRRSRARRTSPIWCRKIRAAHVRAIFTESSINPKLEQQIADEAGVRVYADLYGDTLGPAGSNGATYVQMERWNVTAIVDGLLGEAVPA